jgi:phosphoesterase RecJ-like protein
MKTLTLEQCAEWFEDKDNFLIIGHNRPDGDTLGSGAGLCRGLCELGKTAYILPNPEITARYIAYVSACCAPENYEPDWVIAVDLADEDIIQINAMQYRGAIDLAIDHHPSNKHYAAEELLLSEKASCGEIIYQLLMTMSGHVRSDVALLLYIAVATDTGCFRYKNTKADTHRTAAALIEAGAPAGDLNREFFMLKSRSRLMLESLMISSLDYFMDGEAVICTLSLNMIEKAGVGEEDLEDIAVIAGQVMGTETSVTLRQIEDMKWKVSVRTGIYANASAICAEFGGGGHGMAAGGTIEGDLETAKKIIKASVSRHWKSE